MMVCTWQLAQKTRRLTSYALIYSWLIAQAYVETGDEARRIPTTAATNSIAWHPSKNWLAYAGEDKDGSLRILAFQETKL